jgi:hypothetical protein
VPADVQVRIGVSEAAGTQTAITTGAMLNTAQSVSSYDARSFYVSYTGADLAAAADWELTYTEPQNTAAAAGQLMNLRTIQAVWRNDPTSSNVEDMSEQDAETNTDAFLADLVPNVRQYGVMSLGVGMQGGNPSTTEFSQTGFVYDKTSNGSCSAFASDGSIKSTYQGRLERVIEALGAAGMVCLLGAFYFRQAAVLATMTEVNAAIDNTCDWLIAKGYRNVIIDVANEAGANGSTHWDNPAEGGNTTTGPTFLSDSGIAAMVQRFQTNFVGEPWRPPVGSSVLGIDVAGTGLLRAQGDVFIVHANTVSVTAVSTQGAAVMADATIPGPVLCNEDEKGEAVPPTQTQTDNTETSAINAFNEGISHGWMPASKLQRYHPDTGPSEPFWWEIGDSTAHSGTDRVQLANQLREILNRYETLTGGLDPI